MTPILLYIATYGHDERCGWCVVVVEPEGMFEEYQGVASNSHRAMLWGLHIAFGSISTGEKVGIRSLQRSIVNFENQLTDFQKHGWTEDKNKILLDELLPNMFGCEIKFMDASRHPQAGDSRAKSLAKQAHESYDFSLSDEEISFLSSSIEIQNPFLSSSTTKHLDSEKSDIHPEEKISDDKSSEEFITVIDEPISTPNDSNTSDPHEDECHHIKEPVSESQELLNLTISVKNNTNTLESKNEEADLDNAQHQIPSSKTNPEEENQKQEDTSQTILSIPDGNEYLFGSRILAYVDGVGSGTLGAWAFVLIDRQTGWALLRAKGVSSTTSSRMRLQACIEALSCLKQQSQTIEIRSRYRNLIQMGSSWIDNWKKNDWKNSKKEDVSDLSFLVELDSLRTQHKLSWQYIPYESDEQGIKEVTRLSKNALHNLNYGEYTDIESRIKNYPLHQII
jgi:ribonuclease HI